MRREMTAEPSFISVRVGGAFAMVFRETAKKLRYTAGEFKRTDESMKY